MTIKDYPDFQKEIEVVPVNSIPSVVTDYPDFQREVEVIAGGESMVWFGEWDRESAYSNGATVRYKGHTYVCIEAILAVVGVTGLGPAPKALGTAHWELPAGRPLPIGRIAPSQDFGDVLKLSDPSFKEFDTTVEDPEHPGPPTWRAHAWEFWVKEVRQKTTIVGFGAYAGVGEYHKKGIVHATIGTDGGRQFGATMPNELGEMTAGLMELPEGATKVGGNERYYLIVWGGTWQENGALPKQKLHVTLPLPYLLTPGAGIVEGPGNISPDLDPEHWALVA